MWSEFETARLGGIAQPVCRLGLSASYWPGKRTVFRAVDLGINLFFCYGFDLNMTRALREILPGERGRYVVVTGAYNYIWGHQNLKRTLEKRLRQLRTEYLDAFLFLGVMKGEQLTAKVRDEIEELRADPRVKAVGMSCHDRPFAGKMAAAGALDTFMVRYNAAHRGAEEEVFPHLAAHRPGVISYTATRWGYLIRRPRGWQGAVPDAGMCYRFVLSNPHVDVCLTAPRNVTQLEENVVAFRRGPVSEQERALMYGIGDYVHARYRRFL